MPIEENIEEQWVKVGGPSETTVQIWGTRLPGLDSYGFGDFAVAIEGDGVSAERLVKTMEAGNHSIRAFFRGLAEDWKGERGDPKWDAVEHGMSIQVRRDSLGHVLLTFVLRESYMPDTWSVQATVRVEPGEEMSQLASAIERLIPAP